MNDGFSIADFIKAIERLPSDPPRRVPGVWYLTQKEHWLGWLRDYDGPGAYGRIPRERDARWVYNHGVNPYMLFWLIEASGVDGEQVELARAELANERRYAAMSGAIRRILPWQEVAGALWGASSPRPSARSWLGRLTGRMRSD
jgi:hypothetical protein